MKPPCPGCLLCSRLHSCTGPSPPFIWLLCCISPMFPEGSYGTQPQPWIPRQPSAWGTVSTQTVSLRLLDEQILNRWKKIYWFAVLRHSGSYLNYCSLKTKDSSSLKYVLEKQKEISSFQRMSFGWGLGFFALPFLQHWTYIYLTLVVLLDSSLGNGIAKGKIIYKGARKMCVWILVQALFTENLG